MIKALIVEDDPMSVELLRDYLEDSNAEIAVLGSCGTVKSAIAKINKLKPQLVFLDVELADGSGFDVLKEIATINFEIIVITSHDKYAMEAVKYSALDYLIKPIKSPDLTSALKKVQKRLGVPVSKSAANKVSGRLANKVAVPTFEGLLFIPIEDIIRIQSDRNYTEFYLNTKRKVVVTRSLKSYEALLSDFGFIRIHHSHMINMNHLVKYIKGVGGYVIMSDQSKVDVSRRKKEEFLEQLAKA
ncbi:MAG TPA: LytTR family DNA-binding domain-containing protein [Bacteroidia bacterium]|nr:LytTR family DNA-binding domain-containing protein [Bacteroidia bacterium]HNS11274.1 LytTR family DNA-binding domain-containing protein [Bacteroidia bacterium]